MSLARKMIVLFLVLGVCFGAGSFAALKLAVSPTFENLERAYSKDTIARVEQALSADLRALEVMNQEYSVWDHTYDYALGQRPEFAEDNLNPEYWRNMSMDMMLIFDVSGNVLFGRIDDPSDGAELPLEEELITPLVAGHPLVTHESPPDSEKGLLRTRTGILQVAAYPIMRGNGTGPIAGSVVVGQFLDDVGLADIAQRTTADVALFPLSDSRLPAATATAIAGLRKSDETTYTVDDGSAQRQYLPLYDVSGTEIAALEVVTDKSITQTGVNAIGTALLLIAAASAVFLITAWIFMQQTIIVPVKQLTARILEIRRTGEIKNDTGLHRSDEVGVLAREFGEMTLQLKQAQTELEQARDEAVAMSDTKSEFLARMSHEIRTPMNGVLGMTELLQNTALDSQQERFAETISESAESLLAVINDILDFSKMDAGKLQLDIIDINLRKLLEETVDSLAGQAQRKGLELTNTIPPDMNLTLRADPVRIRQVLTNLIGNAIKFTEEGEVGIATSISPQSGSRVEVLIEVADTGIGIDPEKQSHIFESFTQEDGTTTRQYGGTGLGLAISRQIVDLMGGSLEVESRPGEGSTFSIRLLMESVENKVPEAPAYLPHIAGRRVLIVDDNATNREILELQLSSWRVRTDTVSSAKQALALLISDARFDLAIVDMHMPETNGLELIQEIRSNPDLADLRLLILSSVVTPASETQLNELDVSGQLTKPVRQSQLYDSLIVLMGGDTVRTDEPRKTPVTSGALEGKALLAEDNQVNQSVAIGMLETLGLEVVVANNGAEAVELAAQEYFDIVLMDCQMPIMDGFEATRQIRNQEFDAGELAKPIVALTANALAGDRERCLDAGMNEYLSKPFTGEQLHATLSLFLPSACPVPEDIINALSTQDAAVGSDTDSASPLDESILSALADFQQPGSHDIVQRVINTYLDTTPKLKQQLETAIARSDYHEILESAHSLKSSSANVGATELARLCKRLEMIGLDEDLSNVAAIHDEFGAEYDRVVAALRAKLRSVAA